MENGTLTPVAPAKTGVFEETEVTVAADFDFNVDGSLPGNLAFVIRFASLEKQHIFSYYRGYFLCRLRLDYSVPWEWFSSLAINSSASKLGFI